MAVARMNIMLKNLRENEAEVQKAKKVCPGGKLPVGAIQSGIVAINQEYEKFKTIKKKSMVESFPHRSRRLSIRTQLIHGLENQNQ